MDEDIINDNGQKSIENEPKEFEECKKKCDEYLNNWKRAAADLANYKKDEMERAGLLAGYAKAGIVFSILPVIDSFYLALNHIPEEIKSGAWMQGFLQIQKQIEEFLKKEGIEQIEVMDKPFDPNTMEAIAASNESSGEPREEGVVIEEVQKGYMMEGKVLRPAKVRITK